MAAQHDENIPYPQALNRIEQSLARIEIESERAAIKIEAAAKSAAADAVEAAKQIAVLIERVSTHVGRADLHADSSVVSELQSDMRAQRKWLIGALASFACALVAIVWKVVWESVQKP